MKFIDLNIYKYAFLKTTEKKNDYLQLKNKMCFFHPNLPVRCYVFFPSTLTVKEKLLLAESIQTHLTPRSSLYSDNCSNQCKTFLALNSYLHKTKLICLTQRVY
jgi:hypothetical protein